MKGVSSSNNLFEKFNKCVSSPLKEKISLANIIKQVNKSNMNSLLNDVEIIYELDNKINYYFQILNFKESNSELYLKEIDLFKKYFKSYFQNLTNFDENIFLKLKNDFEKIKVTYDKNLISKAEALEWEIFYNSTNNFFEYLHDTLDKVNYNINLKEIVNNLIKEGNKIISKNDYELNKKYGDKNYFDKTLFSSNKELTNELINNNYIQFKKKYFYEIILMKNADDFSENSYYNNIKLTNNNSNNKIKKKIGKKINLKYSKIIVNINKDETQETFHLIINLIKEHFHRYFISFRDNKQNFIINNNNYLKIVFCGIIKYNKLKNQLINFAMSKIKYNIAIRILFYKKLKYTYISTLKKLKQKIHGYNYFTTNFRFRDKNTTQE